VCTAKQAVSREDAQKRMNARAASAIQSFRCCSLLTQLIVIDLFLRSSSCNRRGSREQRGSELTIDTPNASKSLSFRNQSLEDSANLSDPDVIAAEIVEDLEAALQQFAAIAQDLKK
jgi:hypothetical protein